MRNALIFSLLFFSLCNQTVANKALPFSAMFFLGDSLADSGNNQGLDSEGNHIQLKNADGIYENVQTAPIANKLANGIPLQDVNGHVWTTYLAQFFGYADSIRNENYLIHLLPSYPASENRSLIQITDQEKFDFNANPTARNYAYSAAVSPAILLEILTMALDQGLLNEQELKQILAQGTAELIQATILHAPKKLDSEGLYFYWGGSNDFFGLPHSIEQVVVATLVNIKLLRAMGAKNLVISNLPNFEHSPGAASMLAHKGKPVDVGVKFNAALDIALAASGIHALVIDNARLLNNIAANPASFGYREAADIFGVDELHPNDPAHKVIADVVASQLSPLSTVTNLLASSSANAKSGQQLALGQMDTLDDNTTIFVHGKAKQTLGRQAHDDCYSNMPVQLVIGMGTTINSNSKLMFAVRQTYQQVQSSHNFAHSNQDMLFGMSITGKYFFFKGVGIFGKHSYSNINRTVNLHGHNFTIAGSTNGYSKNAIWQLGLRFSSAKFSFGPLAEFNIMVQDINGYQEKELSEKANVLDLEIYDHHEHSMILGLGLCADFNMTSSTGNIALRGKLLKDCDVRQDHLTIRYRPMSITKTSAEFTIPAASNAMTKAILQLEYQGNQEHSGKIHLSYEITKGELQSSANHSISLGYNAFLG